MDSSLSIDKGNVLLWYPDDGEDMKGYPDLLERLNTALEAGAVLAFVDVPAGDEETADFYAVAARLDSEDESVEIDYAYFGVDPTSNDTDLAVTVWSGDTEISFDANEYTEDTNSEYIYIDENGNILSSDPNPMKYDYVDTCVDGFLEWVKDMNSLKALSEASPDTSVSSSAEASEMFPGVSTSFMPLLHVEPRGYYYTKDLGTQFWYTHKAWHRDTSITFSILPIHHFTEGDDYYVVKVTGNTDPSQQYAHISHTNEGRFDGLGRTGKTGTLLVDNILGYNYKFQYTAQLMASPKITNGKLTGTPVGTLERSAPDTINSTKK